MDLVSVNVKCVCVLSRSRDLDYLLWNIQLTEIKNV